MDYNDITAADVFWAVGAVLMNVTIHVGWMVAERFGEPAGRVAAATVTVYLGLVSVLLGFLAGGALTRVAFRYTWAMFARGFTWEAPPKTAPILTPAQGLTHPPPDGLAGTVSDSDSGTASSGSVIVRGSNKRTRQADCVWLSGKQASSLRLAPCEGKQIKPATLLYNDWLIHHGARAMNANFPLSADLRTIHRLGYSEHKTRTKRSTLCCWNGGVPIPGLEGLECALHSDQRKF